MKKKEDVRDGYKLLENQPATSWESLYEDIEHLKKNVIAAWLGKPNDSAEIESILAIARELKENVEVYLLATDTVLSRLACELLEEWFAKNYTKTPTIALKFNAQHDLIKGLQVENAQQFKNEGLVNLITRFDQLCGGYFGNVVINITGGYKAVIPYLTILGQVNKVPVKYIFEETNTLIEIPGLPLTLDRSLFEKYEREFCLIDEETSLKKPDHYQFVEEAASCLEIGATGEATLNSLGLMLWTKYKSEHFFFYASEEVWNEIQSQKDIQRILKTKFHTPKVRQEKTEKKKEHYVFDDGDNNNRIYYFEESGKVYVYKTFENEPKAKAFINTSLDRQVEIGKAKLRRMSIQGA